MILGSEDTPGHVAAAFDPVGRLARDPGGLGRGHRGAGPADHDPARRGRRHRPSRSASSATNGSERQWLLLSWWPGDGGSAAATSNDPAAGGYASFDTWLDVEVARKTGAWTPELVAGGPDHLTLRNGTRILAQRPAPELGDGYAVARLQEFSEEWWVVTRPGADSTTEALVVTYPFEGDPATLDGFVSHVRAEGVLEGQQ